MAAHEIRRFATQLHGDHAMGSAVIDNLQFSSEAGDTQLFAFSPLYQSFTSVAANIFVDVFEVDGVGQPSAAK